MNTRFERALLLALLCGIGSGMGFAAQAPQPAPQASAHATTSTDEVPAPVKPSRTEQWLQLQASGKAASTKAQQASATERELANQRLLDSYDHPIPEYMPRTTLAE